jgi:hypothetical protein
MKMFGIQNSSERRVSEAPGPNDKLPAFADVGRSVAPNNLGENARIGVRKTVNTQVKLVFLLTFLIHLMSMLSYAIRIAGVRTRRIAVSLALFNILLLISRTSNTFQGPLLAKHVEEKIITGATVGIESDLRWLIVAATLASIVGMITIPTFQRLAGQAIESLGSHRSMLRLLLSTFSLSMVRHLRASASVPVKGNITRLVWRQAPWNMLVYNALASAMLTVGVFASLYAGYLTPELRVTANNLSPVVNAVSTVLLFVFIDPYLSLLTDDVVAGRTSEVHFRRCIVMLGSSRLAGTVLAQLFLTPAARLIAAVARVL